MYDDNNEIKWSTLKDVTRGNAPAICLLIKSADVNPDLMRGKENRTLFFEGSLVMMI
jgi:hypothetical protein